MLLGNSLGHLIAAASGASPVSPVPPVPGCRLWLPFIENADPEIDLTGEAVQAVDFAEASYYWDAAEVLQRVTASYMPKLGISRPGLPGRGLILDGGHRNLVASNIGTWTLAETTRTFHSNRYVHGSIAYALRESSADAVHKATSLAGATYILNAEPIVCMAVVEPIANDRWIILAALHSPETVKVAFNPNSGVVNVLAGDTQIQRTGLLPLGSNRYLCWFQFYRATTSGATPSMEITLSAGGADAGYLGNGTSGFIIHHAGLEHGCYPLRPPSIGATTSWMMAEGISLNTASLFASDWTVLLTWTPFLDSPWVTGMPQYGQAQAFTTFDGMTGGTTLRMYSSSTQGSGIAFDWCVNDEPIDACTLPTDFTAGQPIAIAAELGDSYQRLFIRKPGQSTAGSTLVTDITSNPWFQVGGGFYGAGGVIRDFMVYPVLTAPQVDTLLSWMLARA